MDTGKTSYEENKRVTLRDETKGTSLGLEAVRGFAYLLFAFFLGGAELPFGSYPLGLALLSGSDIKVPYIFAGVIAASVMGDEAVVSACAYSAVLLIRVIVRFTLDRPIGKEDDGGTLGELFSTLFKENILLRMTAASVGGFTVGIYRLISGGFVYYDLYGAILEILLPPVAVLLVGGMFGERTRSGYVYLSAALLGFAVVCSAKGYSLYGIDVAAFLAMIGTLYVSRKWGVVRGIAAAIILGIGFSPVYAPAFIFASLAFSALGRVSRVFGALAAFSVAVSWGMYVDGISAVTSLLPAFLSSAVIFSVADKIFSAKEARDEVEKPESAEEARESEKAVCAVAEDALAEERMRAVEARVELMGETFVALSGFFYDLGEKMKKPLAGDIKQICDESFDRCCGNCKSKELCWDENCAETMGIVSSISAHIHREGRLEGDNIPEGFRRRCERLSDIVDEINHNCMLHTKQLLLCDKTEIFAADYEAMAELISAAVKRDSEEFTVDRQLSETVCEKMSELYPKIRTAVVFGNKKKRVMLYCQDPLWLNENRESLMKSISDVLGYPIEDGGIRERNGVSVLSLAVRRRFKVDFAKSASRAIDEEKFCGDSISVFENAEDKFYALISDGMGSGRDAALTSGICAIFCGRMLTASNKCETTLRMLNGFLRNKGGGSMHECSATVDLMELDLICGRASFYKSGAAPTYVFRDGGLFKLRSKTVPLGIIKELDAKRISFNVDEGDTIVMVSDGVTGGRDDCPWLFEILKKSVDGQSPEATAELICQRAKRENPSDDISVVVARIGRSA